MKLLQRHPKNPILQPKPVHPWEALNTFNAAAIYHNGLFHILYRAQGTDYISHIGYAVSEDAVTWSRLDRPILSPACDYESRGVEDPRITYLEGKFYMTYTAWSPHGIRAALAISDNLVSWKRMGIMLPDETNKDTALFPERIDGRYCLLHRREPDIWIAYSDDLLNWTNHKKIMSPIPNTWQHRKIGIAGAPMPTELGWLLIYHGVDQRMVYRLGVALLDRNDPSQVLQRCDDFILEPEEIWEIKGDVQNVVFSCGHIFHQEQLYLFYGGADRVMGLATCPTEKIFAFIGIQDNAHRIHHDFVYSKAHLPETAMGVNPTSVSAGP